MNYNVQKYNFSCFFFTDVKLDLSTLKEERRLRVFESKVLRKISGPKRTTA